MRDATTASARRRPGPLAALVLTACWCTATASTSASSATAGVAVTQAYATALETPAVTHMTVRSLARSLQDVNETTALSGDGPRRRREGWDMLGPGLLVGGTLALLVLAAVGHLASKALLASMLSAALSAVQLARPPPPNRPG